MKRLSDLLGDHHDLAVLKRTVARVPDDFGGRERVRAFLRFVDRRRIQLQREAHALGQRVYAEKPKCIVRRLLAYWRAQIEERGRVSGRRAQKGKRT